MIDLTNKEYVRKLQDSLSLVFDTPQGQEVMEYLEKICSWYPSVFDTTDTNDIIARDATRKVCGTLKTLMRLPPETIVALANAKER